MDLQLINRKGQPTTWVAANLDVSDTLLDHTRDLSITTLVHVLFPQHLSLDGHNSVHDRAQWLGRIMQDYPCGDIEWSQLLSFGTAEHATAGYVLNDHDLVFLNTGVDPVVLRRYRFATTAEKNQFIQRLLAKNNAFQSQADVDALSAAHEPIELEPWGSFTQLRVLDERYICHQLQTGSIAAQHAGDCVVKSFLTLFLWLTAVFCSPLKAVSCEFFIRVACLAQLRRHFAQLPNLRSHEELDIWNLMQKEYPAGRAGTTIYMPLDLGAVCPKEEFAACNATELRAAPEPLTYLLTRDSWVLKPHMLALKQTPLSGPMPEPRLLALLHAALQLPKGKNAALETRCVACLSVLLHWIGSQPDCLASLVALQRPGAEMDPAAYPATFCESLLTVPELQVLARYRHLCFGRAGDTDSTTNTNDTDDTGDRQAALDQLQQACGGVRVYASAENTPFYHYLLQLLRLPDAASICFVTFLNQTFSAKQTFVDFPAQDAAEDCSALFPLVFALLNHRWPDSHDVFGAVPLFYNDMLRDGTPYRPQHLWDRQMVTLLGQPFAPRYHPDYMAFWQQNLPRMQANALRLWRRNRNTQDGVAILIGLFGPAVPAELQPLPEPRTHKEHLFNAWVLREEPFAGLQGSDAETIELFGVVQFLAGSCGQTPASLFANLSPDQLDGTDSADASEDFRTFVQSVQRSNLPHLWQPLRRQLVVQAGVERLFITEPWHFQNRVFRFGNWRDALCDLLQPHSNHVHTALLVDETQQRHVLFLVDTTVPSRTETLFRMPSPTTLLASFAIVPLKTRLVVSSLDRPLVARAMALTENYSGACQLADRSSNTFAVAVHRQLLLLLTQQQQQLAPGPDDLLQARWLISRFPGPPLLMVRLHPGLLRFARELLGDLPLGRQWTPATFAFTVATGLTPRLDQLDFVDALLRKPRGTLLAQELLMGRGKSRVVLPLYVLHLLLAGRSVDWVVPDHLLTQTQDTAAFLFMELDNDDSLGRLNVSGYSAYMLDFAAQDEKRLLLLDELDTLADPRSSQVIRGSGLQFHSLGHDATFVAGYCAALAHCLVSAGPRGWEFDGLADALWFLPQAHVRNVLQQRLESALVTANGLKLMVDYGPSNSNKGGGDLAVPYDGYDRPRVGSQFQNEDLTAVLTVMMWLANSKQLQGRLDTENVLERWTQRLASMQLSPSANEPYVQTLLQTEILPQLQVATSVQKRNFHDLYFARDCVAVSGTHSVSLLPAMGWTKPMTMDLAGQAEIKALFSAKPVMTFVPSIELVFARMVRSGLRCLIDVSAALSRSSWGSNRIVAQRWLHSLRHAAQPHARVFYFSGDVLRDCDSEQPFVAADVHTHVYFDQGHTVGVDVALEPSMQAVLLLAEDTTLKDAAQAVFRMRHVTRRSFKVWCKPTRPTFRWPQDQDLYQTLKDNEARLLAQTAAVNLAQAQEALERRPSAPAGARAELSRLLAAADSAESGRNTQRVFLTARVAPTAVDLGCYPGDGSFDVGHKAVCDSVVNRTLSKLGLQLTPAAMAVIQQKFELQDAGDSFEVVSLGKDLIVTTEFEWLAWRSQPDNAIQLATDTLLGVRLIRGAPVRLSEQLHELASGRLNDEELRALLRLQPNLPWVWKQAAQSTIASVLAHYRAMCRDQVLFRNSFSGVDMDWAWFCYEVTEAAKGSFDRDRPRGKRSRRGDKSAQPRETAVTAAQQVAVAQPRYCRSHQGPL